MEDADQKQSIPSNKFENAKRGKTPMKETTFFKKRKIYFEWNRKSSQCF